MTIAFFRTSEHGRLPERATVGAAGYDLHTCVPYTIYPGERCLISTGIGTQIAPGWVGLIRERSSLARRGITTRAGVIDSDYRGEIQVLVYHEGDESVSWDVGARIAQMVVVPCCDAPSRMIDAPDATVRGEGSFGSTGA